MKKESQTYSMSGRAAINTTITTQTDVIADIRSIQGITTVSFSPLHKEDPLVAYDNQNYEGGLELKIDTFPFPNFDKNKVLKDITAQIRRVPAMNFYRPTMVSLMENEII
jgi:hypothetical protein